MWRVVAMHRCAVVCQVCVRLLSVTVVAADDYLGASSDVEQIATQASASHSVGYRGHPYDKRHAFRPVPSVGLLGLPFDLDGRMPKLRTWRAP
jgi:hypothetical protein